LLLEAYEKLGPQWSKISSDYLPEFGRKQIRRFFLRLISKKEKEEKSELDAQSKACKRPKVNGQFSGTLVWTKEMDKSVLLSWKQFGDDVSSWPQKAIDQVEERSTHQIQSRLVYLLEQIGSLAK
jgi:hypothetical protein